MPETYRVGLLGHGTVGAAFEQLLARARRRDRAHHRATSPRSRGVLTRSRGDFDEILANSDLIVELIGGIEPARDYVLQAMRAGKHVVSRQQAAARLARRGAVERARASTRSSCASRAPWRASCRSSACCRSRSPAPTWSASTGSSTARRTSSSPRWRAAARPTRRRSQRAQELGYAEADPTDDVTGRDAAAKMAILARLAFSTPVHLDQVDLRGHRAHHRRGRRLRARPRARPEADRHRRARRRRHQRPRAPRVPLSRPPAGVRQRLLQRRHDRVRRDHRDHALRPRRGRPADRQRGAGRRDQRDDPARLARRRRPRRCRSSRTSSPRSTSRWRSTTSPACSRRWPRCSGMQGASIKSVAAARARRPGAAVMVLHPLLESRFYGAVQLISRMPFVRSAAARDPRHRRGVRVAMGLITRYRERLPFAPGDPVVSLEEGSTPLVLAERVSERAGVEVWLKLEGANPTGSFKDRGMTCAVSDAVREGAEAVICASTGNTAASLAAYAARAGLRGAVIVPDGKIATGKLAQALMHGARVIALRGNFDEALKLVRELCQRHPIALVNSVNPFRARGPEDRGLRGARRARRARRAVHPGRQRGQRHRLLEGLHRRWAPRRGCSASRPRARRRWCTARRSRTRRRSRARSGSATRRAGRRRWRPSRPRAARSPRSATRRSSTPTASWPPTRACSASRRPPPRSPAC